MKPKLFRSATLHLAAVAAGLIFLAARPSSLVPSPSSLVPGPSSLVTSPSPLVRSPSHFRLALPGYTWHFPADAYAHPEFANEWWYFTGNLRTAGGREFGFELTFFRISPAPGTPLGQQLFFTHFAISDIGAKRFFARERARRGNWGQAGVRRTPHGFELWNENWQARFDATGPRSLHAAWGAQRLDLSLTSGRRMLNGINGWSQKGSAKGEASYYYSFPHIEARGSIDGQPVTGLAWMDHEFATDQLSPNQQGWDWMGLHLPHADLLLFNLRLKNGDRDPHSAGTFRPRGGKPIALSESDFTMTPVRWWRRYPVEWRVAIPGRELAFTVNARMDDQELHAPASGVRYWEGAVGVKGTHAGRPVSGEGYLELTGYGQRFNLLQAPSR